MNFGGKNLATDPKIYAILETYGEGKDAVWAIQGTNVIKHAPLERIARKAGITFDAPQVVEANGTAKCVAVCVFGHMGEAVEWSFGESAPYNTRDVTKEGKPMATYPYAMAEKRAKDRVILKLIGLHGMVYSEDEADDFKAPAITTGHDAAFATAARTPEPPNDGWPGPDPAKMSKPKPATLSPDDWI